MTSFNNHANLNTPSSRYIKLQIQYGSDLYELLLSSKDHQICVEHILDEIERLTKIPKCQQSLMYKGQRLDHTPKANLDDLYIFNNSKLILTGTRKQLQHQYSALDHVKTNTSLSKSTSAQGRNHGTTNVKEEQSNRTTGSTEDNDTSIIKRPSPLVFPTEQNQHSHPIGFTPEPNKNYEYYTVPYKTDPTTLLRNIPPSTSHMHRS